MCIIDTVLDLDFLLEADIIDMEIAFFKSNKTHC